MALTTRAHEILRDHFESIVGARSLAVDATCGNGHDTEFLCSLGFKRVLGFDIQPKAVKTAAHRLEAAGFNNFTLLQQSHAELDQFVAEKIDCAMFNFGYLPHGDKTITTHAESSVSALRKCTELLADSGIVSALCYPGHDQGYEETLAILTFLESLPSAYKLRKVRSVQATDRTPLLLVLDKTNQ